MKNFILFLFLISTFSAFSQRGKNLSEMSKEEAAQKKYEDSMAKVRNDFQAGFSTREYFQKLKTLKEEKDKFILNETLENLNSIQGQADTLTQLTIQSSALSILPSYISNFKKLKTLTLRRCKSIHLEDLFEKIKDLPELSELNIIFSEKEKLPENIGLLKKVKVLNLNGNKITSLPIGMTNMSKLESINLHNNLFIDVNQVFEVLSKVKTLKEINLSGCKVEDLGENIGKMTQIEKLDLNLNLISTIPLTVESMTNLKSINLSKNNNINTISSFSSLGKIPNLAEINLEDCGLKEIPGSIGIMTQIKSLNLIGNPIVKISSEIGKLVNLESLSIGAGLNSKEVVKLASLPSDLSKCTNLKVLSLRYCSMTDVPAGFSELKNLEYVDLSFNQIKDFPLFLKTTNKLKYLNLSKNKINEFPSDIGQMGVSLETFLCEANFYSPFNEKISKMPLSVARLKNLKILSFQDQVFETLPPNFWIECNQIEELNLMGGLIQEIPAEIEKMTELRVLNLKSNEVKGVSASLSNLKKLEVLNLSYNPELNSFELFTAIQSMPSLKTLDISYNEIKRDVVAPIKALLPNLKIIKQELKDSPEYEKPKKQLSVKGKK